MAMERALSEASKGWGRVSPNPLVGCVILDKNFQFLSSGYHAFYGGPHAEVEAVQKLSMDQLNGAHVIVTLEPCSHYGKTPPCADMLARLPIESVTYGQLDPNPLVSGKGIQILENAGKKTFFLKSYAEKCANLAENFLYPMVHQKPFVAFKVALSQEECIAFKNSENQVWLSHPKALEHVHYLRAQYDAILVGKNTVLKDNPKLNIRHPDFLDKTNKVIVLDPDGELILQKQLNLFQVRPQSHVYFVTKKEMGPQSIVCPINKENFFDLDYLFKNLFRMNIKSVLVEGGARVYRSLISQNAFQRAYVFKTTYQFGDQGLHWTEGMYPLNNLSLTHTSLQEFGDNLLLTGICVNSNT